MLELTRTRTTLLISLMVIAVFAANGVIGFFNLRRIDRNSREVIHTQAVLAELKAVRTLLTEAETGARGYVIAGNKAFLTPYESAIQSVDESYQRLQRLTSDNAAQQGRLADLEPYLVKRVAHLREIVALRERGEVERAMASISSGEGLDSMEQIRQGLRNMEEHEYDLLETRGAEFRDAHSTALATGILTTLLGFGFTIAAYLVIQRESLRREQTANELRQVNEFLEQRVADRTGEITRANSVLRNEIDERRNAEEQVRLFAEELQRSNRELEQFAAVASHDLQEPLRKIQAFGDRLGMRYRQELGEQGQDYLDRMLASAQRMRTLIDDLLEYSRVTTKSQPFAEVCLTDVVREVAGDLEARVQQSGGNIEVGELPVVRASPLQMRQLFQNLIGNALKFHRPNVPPRVRISANPANNGDDARSHALRYEIVVEDNGIGFEPQYGERIFDLFQRLHGREEYDGTGIGLAICRKIVDRHDGRITAQGTPGAGARFVVTLPAPEQAPGTTT